MLVLQAYGSLLDWLKGGHSVVVLQGLGGVVVWLGLISVNLLTYLEFLALGPVQLSGLDVWEPGLGAEMVHLFGTGVCTVRRTGTFSFDYMGKPFSKFSGLNHVKMFFLFYCIIPSVRKLFKFNFEVLSLNTAGIGGHSDSNKWQKLFNYLKKHSSPKAVVFLQETHSTKKVENSWRSQWGCEKR